MIHFFSSQPFDVYTRTVSEIISKNRRKIQREVHKGTVSQELQALFIKRHVSPSLGWPESGIFGKILESFSFLYVFKH